MSCLVCSLSSLDDDDDDDDDFLCVVLDALC